jgi:RimJ/RimL family protein N-acetyltransferase
MKFVTARLSLQLICHDHVELLVALDSDPEVMRYINGGHPSSRSAVEAMVDRSIGKRWLAFDRVTADFVGWFSLGTFDDDEYELGYRLRRQRWGQGLATEGGKALVDLAFSQRGAQRVWAHTMAVNVRSRAVMERCGLQYVRTFHAEWDVEIPGGEHGDVEYELRRADWEARLAPA